MSDTHDLLPLAVAAARRGGEILLDHFGSADLGAEEKAKNDLVSRADRESETAIVDMIRSAFPEHGVLAEEGGRHAERDDSELRWIIDPLDGTTNFLRCLPYWCVSIACNLGDETVVAAILDPPAPGSIHRLARRRRPAQRPAAAPA